MRIYLDTEFTSLTQSAKLISLALVDENGRSLYIEIKGCTLPENEWLKENVYRNLEWRLEDPEQFYLQNEVHSVGYLPLDEVAKYIQLWLLNYKEIFIWADCVVWDWVLFCELFGGAQQIPKSIFYLPFDLATLIPLSGFAPNTNRDELIEQLNLKGELDEANEKKKTLHNALYDANQTRLIVEALIQPKH